MNTFKANNFICNAPAQIVSGCAAVFIAAAIIDIAIIIDVVIVNINSIVIISPPGTV